MSTLDLLTSLDIGSSQVRVVVAQASTAQILGVGVAPTRGVRKGSIVHVDQAVEAIRQAVESATRMVGMQLQDVHVGVNATHVTLLDSRGVVGIAGPEQEITAADVERVLTAAKVIALPPERTILEVIPKQFIVDGLDEIGDPQGMMGVRLETDALLVTVGRTVVQNLVRCIEKAGLQVAGTIFLPLAEGEFCLTDDERSLGCVLLNLGGGTATITVFEQGHLVSTSVLPIGGEYLTNDIAIGLRVPTEEAEKIKRTHAVASREHASAKESFTVSGSRSDNTFTQQELAQIVGPRLEEMFQLIREHVRSLGLRPEPPGGYVLVGGMAALPHIGSVAQQQLGASVRVARPTGNGNLQDPAYVGGMSIIHWLQKRPTFYQASPASGSKGSTPNRQTVQRQANSPLQRVRNWLSELI